MQLQEELTDTEDKIAAARRYYNATVLRFNTRQQTFPTLHRRAHCSASSRGSSSRPVRASTAGRRDLRPLDDVQEQIRANRWRTIWLLLLFALLVGGARRACSRTSSSRRLLIVVAIGGFVYAIFSWFASGSMVGRHHRRPEDREARLPAALPPARERRHRRGARADARVAADRGLRAERVRRRAQPEERLRRRDDRARRADGRAGARRRCSPTRCRTSATATSA